MPVDEPDLNEDDSPPPQLKVDRTEFLKWRSPRRGTANPERMNNPFWEAMVNAARLSAYQANEQLDGPDSVHAGPCWCFSRYGQSSTLLPDGRTVLIAGEHEDFYDADFYIYNDVVVRHPDGRHEIFGYPESLFPPTDFHSATLIGDRMVLIGSLGYPEGRRPGYTQVVILQLNDFTVRLQETQGECPGWIHGHEARLDSQGLGIVLAGGKVDRGAQLPLVENIDDWRLDLTTWRWQRLTARNWMRWDLRRTDRRPNRLFEIGIARWHREFGKNFPASTHRDDFWKATDEQMDAITELYRPGIPHDPLPSTTEEHNVHRVIVSGVVVRFVEDSHCVQLTVEGDLDAAVALQLAEELRVKLATLEKVPYEMMRI
jgi:hypothetical protein